MLAESAADGWLATSMQQSPSSPAKAETVRIAVPVRISAFLAVGPYCVGPTTSTVPAAVLARRSGSYISSTIAPGWMNVPGETARTV